MTIERTNPDGLHPTPGYHHVTSVRADTLIYLAGQCPLQPSGSLAEGGLEGQTEQVIRNILVALDAARATPEDVVRTVIYVASPVREDLAAVWTQLNASSLAFLVACGNRCRRHGSRWCMTSPAYSRLPADVR